MHIHTETFCSPKQGCTWADYEDAYYPNYLFNQWSDTFRCAVADGATETVFCEQWARLLVKAYCEEKLRLQHLIADLRCLQQQWSLDVNQLILPWYAEPKRLQGAYSTLLGLTLQQKNNLAEVIAIGDSCLFHIHAEQLKNCFPLQRVQQFTHTPSLLPSNYQAEVMNNNVDYQRFKWFERDEFYLMTDALAYWFLEEYEKHAKPWHLLRQLTQSYFLTWISQLRNMKKLQDDDLTLMRVLVLSE